MHQPADRSVTASIQTAAQPKLMCTATCLVDGVFLEVIDRRWTSRQQVFVAVGITLRTRFRVASIQLTNVSGIQPIERQLY